MVSKIDVSVIIPAYNAEQTIKHLVQSLLSEQLNIEVIVINDGSNDKTLSILEGMADPRLVVVSTKNNGVYAARNIGLSIHRGAWVMFLDSDDDIPSDFIKNRLNVANETIADLVVFNALCNSTPIHKKQPYNQTLKGHEWIKHCVANREWPHYLWIQMIKSEFINKHGLQFHSGNSHNDILWTIESALKDGTYFFSTLNDYHYKHNSESITHRPDYYTQRASSYINIIHKILFLSECSEYAKIEKHLCSQALFQCRHFYGLYKKNKLHRQALQTSFRSKISFLHLFRGVKNISDAFFLLKLLKGIHT